MQLAIAGSARCLGESVGYRQPTGLAGLAPEPDHGSEGDIERTVCSIGQRLRRREDCIEIFRDRDIAANRGGTDGSQFTIGFVVGELVVEIGDSVESGANGNVGAGRVARIEHDAEHGAHVRFEGFNALIGDGGEAGAKKHGDEREPDAANHAPHRCSSSDTWRRRREPSEAGPDGSPSPARRCDTRCSSAVADPAASSLHPMPRALRTAPSRRGPSMLHRERLAGRRSSISPMVR